MTNDGIGNIGTIHSTCQVLAYMSMQISFCSKIEVAGVGLHKVLAENTTRRCGDFPDKPGGTDLLTSC